MAVAGEAAAARAGQLLPCPPRLLQRSAPRDAQRRSTPRVACPSASWVRSAWRAARPPRAWCCRGEAAAAALARPRPRWQRRQARARPARAPAAVVARAASSGATDPTRDGGATGWPRQRRPRWPLARPGRARGVAVRVRAPGVATQRPRRPLVVVGRGGAGSPRQCAGAGATPAALAARRRPGRPRTARGKGRTRHWQGGRKVVPRRPPPAAPPGAASSEAAPPARCLCCSPGRWEAP